MPTSATGRVDRHSRSARGGFTLVELLMTVTIIGLAAGAVVLAAPDPRAPVSVEAERFAARLIRAREEAILSGRPVAVEATARGYGFSTFDGLRWTPLSEGPFTDAVWGEGVSLDATDETKRVVFDPTGGAEPASLTLSRDFRRAAITVDAAGEVRLEE